MPGPILLPPSFQNSFWSQDDFRSGMEVLFGKLEQGCLENQEVVAFIKSQATAYHSTAASLSSMPATPTFENSLSTGLSASLAQSFTHIQSIAQRQAAYHEGVASDLERKVLEGFIRWAKVHESRVRGTSEEVLGYVPKPFEERSNGKTKGEGSLVGDYGRLALEVAKLRQTYLAKANHADDLEEEARFHTTIASPKQDIFTPEPRPASPQLQALTSPQAGRFPSSVSPGSGLKRTGTVAERISEKLRMASVNRSAAAMNSMIKEETEGDDSARPTGEKLLPAPPMSNETPATSSRNTSGIVTSGLTSTDPSAPLLLAGLSLPLPGLLSLLNDFARHLSLTLPPHETQNDEDDQGNLRSRSRTTIFGTFDESFSGWELVDWMLSKMEGFGGQRDRADEASSELLRWGLIGRIGMGRGWEATEDTFYVLKDSATDDSPFAIEALRNHIHALTASVRGHNKSASIDAVPPSPSKLSSPSVASLAAASSMLQNYLPQALKNVSSTDPAHIKARREAKTADAEYREALRELEDMRLGIESRLEAGMAQWENWERERLRAVKTVLTQYEQVVSSVPKRMTDLATGVKIAVEAYKPDADLLAMIEGNRTGHFRPKAHIYDSLDSDDYDVTFGIDLRKWGGQQGWKAIMRKEASSEGSRRDAVPNVLAALLRGLDEKYNEVSDDIRRKSWLYLVSLKEIHPLRELINDPHVPVEEMVKEVIKFNPPVIAATIKLWLLELNPPVLGYDCYDNAKTFYKKGDDRNDEEVVRVLTETLSKLSSPQIMVLDMMLAHFQELISGTRTEESNEAFTTKLCLSIGRHFLRPQVENAQTLQELAPSRMLEDLLKHRSALLPPQVERAQKVLERAMPQRKNTRPVDQRISRSKLSVSGEDGREILRTQVPRTPSRASVPSVHTAERGDESDRDESSPVVPVEPSGSGQRAGSEPEPLQATAGDTRAVEHVPVEPEPQEQQTKESASIATETHEVDATPEPVQTDDMVLSLDNENAGFANGGARLSRKRPVSKDLDQPIQEGESSLRRNASGEASKGVVRGPRLATRGPRPVPSKIAAEISSPTSARPSSPSIRDRIANLEKANTNPDRFV